MTPRPAQGEYKSLQRRLHPDLWATRPPPDRMRSAEHAARLNVAYGVLRSPLSRAHYLLRLMGIDHGGDGEGTIEDPELLMAVMDAREAVDDAGRGDAAAGRLRELEAANAVAVRDAEAAIATAFASRALDAAARHARRLTYLERIAAEIRERL